MIPIVVVVIFILLYIKICREERKKEEKDRVKSSSELLKSLKALNESYHFHSDIEPQYFKVREEPFSSKGAFDKYDCDELFDCVVLNEYTELQNIAEKVKNNKRMYEDYKRQLRQLHSTATQETAQQLQILFETYRKIEDCLFLEYQLSPVVRSDIICIARYTSPKGQKSYSKETSHSVFEVASRYQELQKIIAKKNSDQAKRQRERSKMSNSLRYDILRRDGFRCQICGRTQKDGVKLHVDHIIPVAKGGKTEPGNLRTLCDQCNLGKSDKTE